MARPKSLTLTETDQKLFQYLYRFKVASVRQIKRDVFSTYAVRTLYRRLQKLEGYGYLASTACKEKNIVSIFSLTPKAFKEFIEIGTERRIELESQAIAHDLDLLDIKYFFSKSTELISYFSENELKAGINEKIKSLDFLKQIHPDALVEIQLKNIYLLPLEYEANWKFANRYESLFRSYYSYPEIQGVLYICAQESLLKRIKRIEKSIISNEPSKFFYTTFESLLRKSDLTFTNQDGQSIKLNRANISGQSSVTDWPETVSHKIAVNIDDHLSSSKFTATSKNVD